MELMLSSFLGSTPPVRDTNSNKYPVLIIPGFMCSGLTIKKSPHKSWEGTRLWVNVASAGFNSLHVGGRLMKNEKVRSARNLAGGNVRTDQNSDHMHQEYLKQVECKSKWLWHLRLKPDLIHEKEGVVARPVPGTAGVDYLAPGALTESASYVFGPVLKLLKAEGYIEGVNLDAAPYDWRIPPNFLETRDSYFTNTIKTIERLYRKSNNTPVVLLCHSMGCKNGHYLLNFVLYQMGEDDGQAWIDRHIHSYVPVGAPHIGAPKSIRGMMCGDKMGLDAFLNKDEGLILGRSFGSVPWMFPFNSVDGVDSTVTSPQSASETLPQSQPIPPIIVREQSTLRISISEQRIAMKHFLQNRKRIPPTKLRLAIQVGKHVIIRTKFVDVYQEGGSGTPQFYVKFDEAAWLLGCPPTLEQTLHLYPYMQLHLEEPGTGKAPRERRGICHFDILWIFRCIWCLIEWVFCCPCAVIWKLGCCVVKGAKRGADMTAALLGEVRVIGQSGRVDWKKGVIAASLKRNEDGGEGRDSMMYEVWTKIQSTDPVLYGSLLSKIAPEAMFMIKVRWERSTVPSAPTASICLNCHTNAIKHGTYDILKKDIAYNACSSNQLLQMEGLASAVNLLKNTYANDPVHPLSLSSWQAPPVKKVTAIYGINLTTETAAVYKRNPSVRILTSDTSRTIMQPLFVLDKDAALSKEGSKTHDIQDGIISETRTTPQNMIGGGVEQKSGDGTVPYWSLQHCKSWRDKCDVKVHELEGADHREILNDKRFHALLLELLGCR